MNGQNRKFRMPTKRINMKKLESRVRNYLPELHVIAEGNEDEEEDGQTAEVTEYPTKLRRRGGMELQEFFSKKVKERKVEYFEPPKVAPAEVDESPVGNPEPGKVSGAHDSPKTGGVSNGFLKVTGNAPETKEATDSFVEHKQVPSGPKDQQAGSNEKLAVSKETATKLDPNTDPALEEKITAFDEETRAQAESQPDSAVAVTPNQNHLELPPEPGSSETLDFSMNFFCAAPDCSRRNFNEIGYMCPRGHFYCVTCFQKRRPKLQYSFPVVAPRLSEKNKGLCGFLYPSCSNEELEMKIKATGLEYSKLPVSAQEKLAWKEAELIGREMSSNRCLRVVSRREPTDPRYLAMMTYWKRLLEAEEQEKKEENGGN